jgi:hypothetical protein
MTDIRDPDETQPDAADARDERLAALLAVPPLDAVTRRRLVREALDRPVPRPSRWIAAVSIAAAVAVGIFMGVVLVHGNKPATTSTAQGAVPSAANKSEALEAAPRSAADSSTPVTPLGDLGDVTDPADLRAAINSSFQKAVGPTDQVAITGYQCGAMPPETYNLVATSALGLGLYRGFPVTIFVGTSPEGKSLAVVVRQDDCVELASVELPPG